MKRPTYNHPLKDAIHEKYESYDEFALACGVSRFTIISIIGRKQWKNKPIKRQQYVIDGIANALDISYKEAERLIYGL